MISFFKSLFSKPKENTCPCHGYPVEEGKLPVKRTSRGFNVCPNEAVKSSLQQLGSGIKLNDEQAKKLRERLEELKESKEF